jgi:hypothetical protein
MKQRCDRSLETAALRNKVVMAQRELIIIHALVAGRANSAGRWTGQIIVIWNTLLCTW